MVIDDDEVGRTVLTEALRPLCAHVIELSSPLGASVAASREAVEVVVIDVQMPNLTGDMVTKLLRKNPRLSHVGIVLVSADRADELLAIARECGADAVVSKHQIETGLPKALRAALHLSRTRAGREQATPSHGFPGARNSG